VIEEINGVIFSNARVFFEKKNKLFQKLHNNYFVELNFTEALLLSFPNHFQSFSPTQYFFNESFTFDYFNFPLEVDRSCVSFNWKIAE
jgi:hypothetical protein